MKPHCPPAENVLLQTDFLAESQIILLCPKGAALFHAAVAEKMADVLPRSVLLAADFAQAQRQACCVQIPLSTAPPQLTQCHCTVRNAPCSLPDLLNVVMVSRFYCLCLAMQAIRFWRATPRLGMLPTICGWSADAGATATWVPCQQL